VPLWRQSRETGLGTARAVVLANVFLFNLKSWRAEVAASVNTVMQPLLPWFPFPSSIMYAVGHRQVCTVGRARPKEAPRTGASGGTCPCPPRVGQKTLPVVILVFCSSFWGNAKNEAWQCLCMPGMAEVRAVQSPTARLRERFDYGRTFFVRRCGVACLRFRLFFQIALRRQVLGITTIVVDH